MTALVVVALLLSAVAPPSARAQDDAVARFMCEDAPPGFVPEIPAPFDDWVIVLCAPDGQTLAAKVAGDPAIWVMHGTMASVMVRSLPPWVEDRQSMVDSYGPEIRFDTVSGRQLGAEHADQMAGMYGTAFADLPPGSYDTVWQLDVRSVYNFTTYSLFFFNRGGRPYQLVVCVNACQSFMPIDVLTLDEAQARAAE